MDAATSMSKESERNLRRERSACILTMYPPGVLVSADRDRNRSMSQSYNDSMTQFFRSLAVLTLARLDFKRQSAGFGTGSITVGIWELWMERVGAVPPW